MPTSTRISVFGLGYVGTVSAGCFAQLGFDVIGVDIDPSKVELLASGRAPLLEEGLNALIAEQHAAGRLHATDNVEEAVHSSRVSLVCVGTPSAPNGDLDLSYVTRVCEQIGTALKTRSATEQHVVVIRSTVLPGAVQNLLIPTLEKSSGLRAGKDFGVAQNPEFLREGTAIHDFFNPPKTVIGATDEPAAQAVAELYKSIDAPLIITSLGAASMVKYADNAFHAAKITFGNEIGQLCRKLQIDSHEVMEIFCQDRKLNISPVYLKPGFAFGGSCLPKDVRAIVYQARQLDIELPMLANLLPSNRLQIEHLVDELMPFRRSGIGLLGLCFKPGTDDLRESPMVTVVETLLGRGAKIRIHDPSLDLDKLVGANLRYITNEIPHIASLLEDQPDQVVANSKAIVVAHNTPTFREAASKTTAEQTIFDLVRLPDHQWLPGKYVGVCW